MFSKIIKIRRAVIFRWEDGCYGSVTTNSRSPITINIGLHERRIPSRTYLHECIHHLYPLMTERDVRTMEEMIWNTMSSRQRFLLAKKLYNRKWRTR